MKIAARHVFIIAFFAALPAYAAPDGSPKAAGAPPDPIIEKAVRANEEKDFARSQQIMRDALLRDPKNADYHSMYAYAIRMGDKPNLDLVFKHYNEALRLNPKHRGAHEYLGEAYLMVGNVSKAKEHLNALDQICFFGCDEYGLLKKAIAEFEAKPK